jgi:hypothetical protein
MVQLCIISGENPKMQKFRGSEKIEKFQKMIFLNFLLSAVYPIVSHVLDCILVQNLVTIHARTIEWRPLTHAIPAAWQVKVGCAPRGRSPLEMPSS